MAIKNVLRSPIRSPLRSPLISQDEVVINLITNGGFDTTDDWVLQTGWTIAGGVASCSGVQTSNSPIYQQNILSAGLNYRISFDLTLVAGQIRPLIGSAGAGTWVTSSGPVTQEITQSGGLLHVYLQGNADFIGTVDNVVVSLI